MNSFIRDWLYDHSGLLIVFLLVLSIGIHVAFGTRLLLIITILVSVLLINLKPSKGYVKRKYKNKNLF